MKKPELHDAIAKAAGKWFNVLYSPELVVDEESYEKHVSWQVGIDHTQSVVYGEEKDKPKWEDVVKAMDELEAEYASFEFQRKRKPEYPKIEDQLDLFITKESTVGKKKYKK
jgi:hypothetical protein